MTMTLRVLQLCAVDFTVKHFLRPLINFLTNEGFDVTAACSEGPYFQELRREGVRLVSMPIARSMNVLSHTRSTMRLYRYLKKNRFDIIHVHTPIASIIGRVAGWAAHVPIRIYTAHGFYFHDEMPAIQRAFHVRLERFGARFGNFILTQSEEDRQTAISEKITTPERVLTIGNGVDVTGRFNPDHISLEATARCRAEFGIPAGAPVVGIIGRIVREKGYFEFAEAASHILTEFPETHFLCIGDALKSDYDASKIEFQRRIAELKLEERFHFAGLRSDIPDLLSLMTVYVLPSYREGMPRSIIEAMAMARPVVTTSIRGCREEVVEGETGHLVPPRDAVALARAVCSILADPAKAENFGMAGRRRAVSEFSEEDVLCREIRVYEQLIREKGLEARR
jgi:glycosyltransferase involved in cell wall biosynthesis